jgi:hypothetical protein
MENNNKIIHKTFVTSIPYEEEFVISCRTGWGCGYVHIHKDHPIIVKALSNDGYGNYLSPENCPQEITFTEWDKDKEYLVIGFDTAHRYNNSSHDEKYVIEQANDIKALVDEFKEVDACIYALEKIKEVTDLYSKYVKL